MKILHIDIETAPNKGYFWGLWGQNIAINQIEEPGYTLCFAAKWHHHKKIHFHSLQYETKQELMEAAWELLDEADAVVHYNGCKFDIPVLNWEFVQMGMVPPSPYHQIDLYKTVKNKFKSPSNKLDYIAQELGLGNKVHNRGMALWKECMDGEAKAWKEMERYNKQDVRLLPRVYERLLPWIKNHPNHALYHDDNRPVCPNCNSHHVIKKGVETTLTMQYQRYKCTSCGTNIRGRTNITDKDKKKNVLTQSKL